MTEEFISKAIVKKLMLEFKEELITAVDYELRKVENELRKVDYELIALIKFILEIMNVLDEDFVPGPKLAELENRCFKLTGHHRGDEYNG